MRTADWPSTRSPRGEVLALRQLQLDAAVAGVRLLGLLDVDRLVFAEAGRDQSLWGNALAHQILHDRDRAPGRKLPVVLELRAVDRPHVGVTVDPQHPGDFARDTPLELDERAGKLVQLGAAFGLVQGGLAGI